MKTLYLALFATAAATAVYAYPELNVADGSIESADGLFVGREFTLAKDFKMELLYNVPASEGQWVPMTWDNKHRLVVGSHNTDQVFRLTIPSVGTNDAVKVESVGVPIGASEGLLYAFDSLYVDVNRSTTIRPGIYRITDTNKDDKYDKVAVIRNVQPSQGGGAGGDHGTHDLKLTPDGKRITWQAGNETRPTEWQSSRVPMIWGEDNLVMRLQQTGPGFNRAPSSFITSFDPEGKDFELYAMGTRNPVSHQYNKDGEMFVYDSDMEFDKSTPWYRPTNVQHIISGADSGWRDGARKHPTYFFDYHGVIATVGSGSPTGGVFGTGAKFPARYQDAFFICDWSYGNLWAVFINPDGSSYKGEAMPFVSGSPFPVTGALVNEVDGSLLVMTGARATTQLYRITYTGKESTAPTKPDATYAPQRATRKSLEAFHGHPDAKAVPAAWSFLDSPDRATRFAARTALEWQPVATWQDKAIAETNPRAAIAAIASLARVSGRDEWFRGPDYKPADPALKERAIATLERIDIEGIAYQDKLDYLRALSLVFIRMGPPDEATRLRLIAKFYPMLPTRMRELNMDLAEMLIYLQAPSATPKVMALMRTAPSTPFYAIPEYINAVGRPRASAGGSPGSAGGKTNFGLLRQEEQIQYAQLLRTVKVGWTPELSKEFMEWFPVVGRDYSGDNSFAAAIQIMRNDTISQLPAAFKPALQALIDAPLTFTAGRGGRGGAGAAGAGAAGGARGGAVTPATPVPVAPAARGTP